MPSRFTHLLCLSLALALLAPTRAHANPAAATEGTSTPHANRGRALIEQGQYEAALIELRLAQDGNERAPVQLAIALCLERLERLSEAVAAYEAYASSKPRPVDAASAADKARLLRFQLADKQDESAEAARARSDEKTGAKRETAQARQEAVEAPRAAAVDERATSGAPSEGSEAQGGGRRDESDEAFGDAVEATQPEKKKDLLLGAAIGVGAAAVVLLVAGSALVASVAPDYQRLKEGPDSCRPCSPSQVSGLETRANLGYALWGVGGAAAAVDVVLFILRARRGGEPASAPRALLVPTLGGLAAVGRF